MKFPQTKASVHRVIFAAVLLLGFARGMLYANLLPPWGLIDEEQHLDYILKLAEDRQKPVVGESLLSQEIVDSLFAVRRWETFHWRTPASQTPQDMWIEIYSYEAYQAPLYYFLLAPVYAVLKGTVLFKLFFLRWVTVLLSLVTVWIAVRWAKDLFPDQPYLPLLVGLILVLIPERTMATSRVNNDGLLEVMGAAFLCISTRAIADGLTPSKARWMALFLGLGILTKISMAALGSVVILALWQNRRRADLLRSFCWMVGVLTVLLLPFFLYNLFTYGDLTGSIGFKRLLESAGGMPPPALGAGSLLKTLGNIFMHFWVVWWKGAGVGTTPVLSVLYFLLAGLTLISIAGVVFSMRAAPEKNPRWSGRVVWMYLGVTVIYILALLASYFGGKNSPAAQVPEVQGRFFLPVVVPVVILFCAGLYAYPRWRWRLITLAGFVLVAVDSLNLFGNLLRYFYYWAWFFQDGQPVAVSVPTLQDGLNLFFTRFWMDKPESIRAVIYMTLPFYVITLVGVVLAFLQARRHREEDEQPPYLSEDVAAG